MNTLILKRGKWAIFIGLVIALGFPLYGQSIDSGVVVPGQTVTAQAVVPGEIVQKYDTLVDGGGFSTWTHTGPGTWTSTISTSFSGVHTAKFKGKYREKVVGPVTGTGTTPEVLIDWNMDLTANSPDLDHLNVTGAIAIPSTTTFVTSIGSSGEVDIEAVLVPAKAASSLPANFVTWTGGVAGADQLHRKVSKTKAGTTPVSATCKAVTKSVTIIVYEITSLKITDATQSGTTTNYIAFKGPGSVSLEAVLNPAAISSLPIGIVTWVGGVAGADQLHRTVDKATDGHTPVTATCGTSSKMATICIVDPGMDPGSTTLTEIRNKTGSANGNFGLTTPNLPVILNSSYADQSSMVWKLRVKKATSTVSVDIDMRGRQEASATAATAANWHFMVDDISVLRRRTTWWASAAIQAHENAHASRWMGIADAKFKVFQTTVEALTLPVVCPARDTIALAEADLMGLADYTAAENKMIADISADWSVAYKDEGPSHAAERPILDPISAAVTAKAAANNWP